jgi:hypothetical protein
MPTSAAAACVRRDQGAAGKMPVSGILERHGKVIMEMSLILILKPFHLSQ